MKQAHTDVLKQGTIGGFLGYLAIVLYYAAFNVVNGRSPFHTVAAWMIFEVELHPGVWLAALFTLITAFLFTSGVMAMVAGTWADLSVLVVLVGNLLAVAALGGYLAWRHPGLAQRIEHSDDADAELEAENPGPPAEGPDAPVIPSFDQATLQRR